MSPECMVLGIMKGFVLCKGTQPVAIKQIL